ncbi:DNA cytosine methyltransferase [Paenibacillus thermotolerans]|uniref:DNA cytosine methyltransferase n=1 Tax=Paenibacillus thermotolerans TaxID=3027807 RepID=UPI0023685CD3|nr:MULTISPECIES: DNA cytosine methyltransferase [unclassified Paenibacillus]
MARPTAIDLFAGAGGMSLGFEQAGFDVRAAVEIDPIHAAVHMYNFPDTAVLCEDIVNLSGERLLQAAGLEVGQLDVLFGGPPCQGFSLIGKRLIDDPRNALVGHFARLVVETRPRYFVMENVSGLTIGDAKSTLIQFIKEFETTDYKVVMPYKVLNAANYGVPQDRKRLFILGYRNDVEQPSYPEIMTTIRGKKGVEGMNAPEKPWCPSISEAIQDLPNIDNYKELVNSDTIPFVYRPESSYASCLNGKQVDSEDYSYPRIWNNKLLTSSLRTEHTDVSKERFSNTNGGEVEPISRFFKLHVDGICNTLRAGTDSKRGAYTSPRPIHPLHNRCISVREAARIHSFPDWFRLHVTKWHGFREVGNSVPPLLGRAIAKQLVKAMGLTIVKPDIAIELGDENLLKMDMTNASQYFNVPRDVIGTRQRKTV